MNLLSHIARLWRAERGASAAEFALILPAALLIMFGVIDVGRYAWQINQYEKAVQLGARYAVATTAVPGDLALDTAFDGVSCGGAALEYGDAICTEAMKPIVCSSTSAGVVGCTCLTEAESAGGVCLAGNQNKTAFDNIVTRMRAGSRRITSDEVKVEYRGSGLGYYGDPTTTKDSSGTVVPLPDAAPIVTVKLTGLHYYPITLGPLEYGVPYPVISYSLTMEDGDGTVAS